MLVFPFFHLLRASLAGILGGKNVGTPSEFFGVAVGVGGVGGIKGDDICLLIHCNKSFQAIAALPW